MVNKEQNNILISHPTIVKLNNVVFSMNPQSAAGIDVMNGYFLQNCWHIINQDLKLVIKVFFFSV